MSRSDSSDCERKSRRRSRYRSRSDSSERKRLHRYKSRSRSRDGKSRSTQRRSTRSKDSYRRSSSSSREDKRERKKLRLKDKTELKLPKTKDSKSLKDKIKALTVKSEQPVPSYEAVTKIDKDGFKQEKFVSINSQVPQHQQQSGKKKKKKKKTLVVVKQVEKDVPEIKLPSISHECAIFGATAETMHVGKFSSRIDTKRKEVLKNVDSDDVIFGAMFCEDPEIRMERWIKKLTEIRKKLRKSRET